MKANILEKFKENKSTCFLSSVNLKEYISSLPSDYKSYEVQREIVKNTYLDNLISTIISGNHIPPIVLVIEEGEYTIIDDQIRIKKYKILDGLQRTFRLKLIFDTIQLLLKQLTSNEEEILDLSKLQLNRRFKEDLLAIDSNSTILFDLKEFARKDGQKQLEKLYERQQWFEIWKDLSPDEEVNKMLILNAGHKPVKTKHQLELLFRNIIPILQKVDFPEFELIREKEVSSIQYSKSRVKGQFHFSHIITSVLSLSEGKTLTTNTNLIQKTQSNYFNDEVFDKFLHIDFLKEFIKSLLEIDNAVTNHFDNIGIKWMGRETSLVGMFAATGKYINENYIKPIEALKHLQNVIITNPNLLALEDFEKQRNSLDLAKVNIGNVNKKAVYEGLTTILNGDTQEINWSLYFKTN
jgi:hypothetical protein